METFSLQCLNQNLLGLILEYLNPKEICRVGATCKKLLAASERDRVWALSHDQGTGQERKRTFLRRGNVTMNIFAGKPPMYMLEGHCDMINDIHCAGDQVFTASRDCRVGVWDLQRSKGHFLEGHSNWVLTAFPWQDKIVSVSSDKTIRLWQDRKVVKVLNAHRQGITVHCRAGEDSAVLATGSHDSEVKLWDLRRGKLRDSAKYFSSTVSCIQIDQGFLACSSQEEPKVFVRDLTHCQTLVEVETPRQPNGRRLTLYSNEARALLLKYPILYTGGTNSVKVWDLRSPARAGQLEIPYSLRKTMKIAHGEPRGIFRILKSEPTNTLVVGCMGLMGLLGFDLRKLKESFYVKAHDYPILAVDSGATVLNHLAVSSGTSASYQYELSVHDLASPLERKIKYVPGHKAVITTVKVADDVLFSGAKDGSVKGLNFRTRKELLRNSHKVKRIVSS